MTTQDSAQHRTRRKVTSAAAATALAESPPKRARAATTRPPRRDSGIDPPAGSSGSLAPLIVGIGASAGGLEAYKSFFAHMPADSEMAFVLVQHLAPSHASLLADLIGRGTKMKVIEAVDGDSVLPRHVYVIPPDATLTILKGALRVKKPAPPRPERWPIDTFFMSLAADQGDCAVSIVLSGSGSDGARGLRAIKEHGGLTLAQAGLDHAALSGMPASAAATGLVDDVLPVEEMPARLKAHQEFLRATHENKGPDGIRHDVPSHLVDITRLLHADSGHDFSQYKEKTLVRRIQRRMQVVQTETVPHYIEHLRQRPGELQNLFQEFLISVTEFFRDPPAFELLHRRVIPTLLADKGAADTLRVWVPGCATGEEAYSIAILLKESMRAAHGLPKVQIFATDIDERAIGAARAGRFRGPLAGVSPERLERWFQKDGDDYVVSKSIREWCIFSPHSAIKDPPFTRLDLVSCRNLLIYMNADLQERVVRVFHYALKRGGYLLLGPSEGLSRNGKLFSVIDKKHRLYLRREDSSTRLPPLPGRPTTGASFAAPPRNLAAQSRTSADDLMERNARRALEMHSPAYVVIDNQHDVLRFCGDTGRYLQPTSGAASLNLFSLLHRGLRGAARSAVQQAFAEQRSVLRDDLSFLVDGQPRALQLIVEPLPETDGATQLCVVAFRERDPEQNPAIGEETNAEHRSAHRLEQELEGIRLQLQVAIDQYETVNEELKSANEEYQSVNEELQSSNEELETSKEEMQSINEELHVVNAELHTKNVALTRANSDLGNLMESTQIATLFLDAQLHVTGFTPVITELFHLREGDVGRPITEISSRISYPELAQDVQQVVRDLMMIERVLQDGGNGPVYLLRMRPYRTVDNVIDGVVLTFTDITESRAHEVDRGLLAAIVDSSKDMIIGHTKDGIITSWNESACEHLGYTVRKAIGQSLAMLLPTGSAGVPALLHACDFATSQEVEMTWQRRDGTEINVDLSCSPVRDDSGAVVSGSLIARDSTERQRAVRHMEMMLGELNHRVKNTLATVQSIAQLTVSNTATPETFKKAFLARLQALSYTHNLLARDSWTGVGLREIVLAELAPFERADEARIHLTCDKLTLTPKTALALSMAMHELTTNAVKYGALSVSEGQVIVHCEPLQKDGERWLLIEWHERGGPPVTPPTQHGFGSRLIADGLAFELDGKVSLDFDPAGVICRIEVPLTEPMP